MKKAIADALKMVKPSREQRREVSKRIDLFMRKLGGNLKNAKAVLGGSGAKDSWLPGLNEADVFVQFDYKTYKDKDDRLSDMLERALKKTFGRAQRIHGSRDYFRVKDGEFLFEVVPILKIRKPEEARNITDISPLHAKWVKKHKKLADQMRLSKAFAKANKIYGAESYIKGFSGYALEILTVHYGSFEKFIRAVARWKDRKVIDMAKHHKNVDLEVNRSKLESPLVLIDPVQAGRNASAAVSKEKYELLKSLAKDFIKKPSADYFVPSKIAIEDIRQRARKYPAVILAARPLRGNPDVVGCKLLKGFEFISGRLDRFGLKESGWDWPGRGRALFWFILKKDRLPDTFVFAGPPIMIEKHVKKFRKKYRKTHVKRGRIYATVKDPYPRLNAYLKNVLKEDYLKDKTRGIEWQ